ncbi:MAG: ArsR family transcriptional regulator [Desulfobacula sp.]|jgi:DNA-binding transcriptional ArsR family regulator|nr:ArsR family transcriptional regulator [Desulfobacula sp.]
MEDMFAGFVTSKIKIKLLIKFFFNPAIRSYLRELSSEFNVSTNAVRQELNLLTESRLLHTEKKGRQIFYSANQNHPLFEELTSIARKTMGVDKVIDGIVSRLGDLELAYLIDDYAEGKDTGVVDLLFVGNIDPYNLYELCIKTERYIKRKIRSLVLSRKEFEAFLPKLEKRKHILIWEMK